MKNLIKLLSACCLLVVSNLALAQFKVEIKNLDGAVTHSAEFKTREELDLWVEKQDSAKSWGKHERLVPLEGTTDEERALSIEVIPADEETKTQSMLKLRKMYVIGDVQDRTEEIALAKAEVELKESKKLAAKESLKSCAPAEIESATTIAAIKSALKKCLPHLVELLKEEL